MLRATPSIWEASPKNVAAKFKSLVVNSFCFSSYASLLASAFLLISLLAVTTICPSYRGLNSAFLRLDSISRLWIGKWNSYDMASNFLRLRFSASSSAMIWSSISACLSSSSCTVVTNRSIYLYFSTILKLCFCIVKFSSCKDLS